MEIWKIRKCRKNWPRKVRVTELWQFRGWLSNTERPLNIRCHEYKTRSKSLVLHVVPPVFAVEGQEKYKGREIFNQDWNFARRI